MPVKGLLAQWYLILISRPCLSAFFGQAPTLDWECSELMESIEQSLFNSPHTKRVVLWVDESFALHRLNVGD